jgi:SAM-dependent methyltransferase
MNFFKQVVLNTLILVPSVRRLASRRHRTGMNNDEAQVNYTYGNLRRHIDPIGKDVLELGPGQTPRLLERARTEGARSVSGLDVGPKPQGWPDGISHQSYQGRDLPFADGLFDVVWSNSCLEHVRHPRLTVEEVRRVLRPGGVFVSSIDLRDHFHSDRHLHAEHLRYPTWLWNAMTWNRSVFTNRLRWNDWRQLLEGQGFELQVFEPEQCEVLTSVYGRHPARHRFSLDQFAVVGLFFVARKKARE